MKLWPLAQATLFVNIFYSFPISQAKSNSNCGINLSSFLLQILFYLTLIYFCYHWNNFCYQVDLSLLEFATGARPLPLDRLAAEHGGDEDDASMVVEVNSAADDDIETATPSTAATAMVESSPFKQPPEPPLRVMHRSWCPDDDVRIIDRWLFYQLTNY